MIDGQEVNLETHSLRVEDALPALNPTKEMALERISRTPASATLGALLPLREPVRLRDPAEQLLVQVGGVADDEVRRPAAGARLGLGRDPGRLKGRGQAEREHEVVVRQPRLLPHLQERHAGEEVAVVVGNLRLLHLTRVSGNSASSFS